MPASSSPIKRVSRAPARSAPTFLFTATWAWRPGEAGAFAGAVVPAFEIVSASTLVVQIETFAQVFAG